LDWPLTEPELEIQFNFLQFIPNKFRFKALNLDIRIIDMDLQINIQSAIEENVADINIKQGRTRTLPCGTSALICLMVHAVLLTAVE
jgi:hypothetical protein